MLCMMVMLFILYMDMSLDFDKIIVNQMKLFTTQVTDLNEERLKRTG